MEELILPLYKQYKQIRETAENHVCLKYNLFVENTSEFVKIIFEFLKLQSSKEDIEFLTQEASPIQKTETMQYKRSGKTGQYLEKLNPDTVEKLNHILSEVLSDWEFKL